MSLHIFNSINKSWAMYTHTLSSISGDDLTLKPHDGKNISLEVSGNSAIVIKQGDVSYNLSSLISGTGLGTVLTIANGSDACFNNVDVSRNLNPLTINNASLGLTTKNWGSAYINTIYGETLNTYRSDKTLSINSGTLLISGELVAKSNLNPLLSNRSSLGLSTNTWSNAYIRSLSGGVIEVSDNILPLINLTSNIGTALNRTKTLFVDDLSINKINGQVYSSSGPPIILTSVSGDIIPANTNLFKLGDVSRNWSNAYIRDLSVSSIDVSGNLNPLTNNFSSLGIISKTWGNAYIRDVSVSSIDVSGNLNPLTNNGSSLGLSTRRWGNAYLRDVSVSSIDVSNNLNPLTHNGSSLGLPGKIWGNAYIRDVSAGNIDVSGNLNPLTTNTSSMGLSARIWGNAYIRDISISSIDVSINSINPFLNNRSSLGLISMLWRNAYFRDLSATNIDISTSLIPSASAPSSSLGLSTKYWGNAYIRDISASSINVSGNIIPSINNTLTLGSSLKRWNRVFVDNLNVTTINGATYTSGGGGGVLSITSNMIPSTTNTYSLGSTTKYWNNAYIRDLSLSNRAYQEISGDISWSAVNGYYGLAKDAYPSLNPLSSGVKAVQTWRVPTQSIDNNGSFSVCWSPELRIFVSVSHAGTANRVMYSTNGINWIGVSQGVPSYGWRGVCWSPLLRRFAAIAYTGQCMYSNSGILWVESTQHPGGNGWQNAICWSQELEIFLAVSDGLSVVTTSKNGIIWSNTNLPFAGNWNTVCWSPELKLFVALAVSGTNRIMISNNGITWNVIPVDSTLQSDWISVCWSKELGLFVAVALSGTNRIMTSNNGTIWRGVFISPELNLFAICWSSELGIFVAAIHQFHGGIITSNNGSTWGSLITINNATNVRGLCWSPELGIFVITGLRTSSSSLKGRPPTSYNVFDSSFNSIDETGKWTFLTMATRTMTVQGSNVTSDDRLKHNEVVINNGLAVIDQLRPKFYQKTQTLLDASYNGDLSGQAWTYEAGLIAQEVLQIPDLSFAVSGGDYYEEIINYNDISAILINQTNDASNNYDASSDHITRANYYSTRTNYTISYNLVTQPYSLNYNSIFTYGIAAIKELHTKVKIQETNSLDDQLNSLIERIEALEQSPN